MVMSRKFSGVIAATMGFAILVGATSAGIAGTPVLSAAQEKKLAKEQFLYDTVMLHETPAQAMAQVLAGLGGDAANSGLAITALIHLAYGDGMTRDQEAKVLANIAASEPGLASIIITEVDAHGGDLESSYDSCAANPSCS